MKQDKVYELEITEEELQELNGWIEKWGLGKNKFILLATEWWLRKTKAKLNLNDADREGPHFLFKEFKDE